MQGLFSSRGWGQRPGWCCSSGAVCSQVPAVSPRPAMEKWSLMTITVLLALTVRWAVSLGSYSGKDLPRLGSLRDRGYGAWEKWKEMGFVDYLFYCCLHKVINVFCWVLYFSSSWFPGEFLFLIFWSVPWLTPQFGEKLWEKNTITGGFLCVWCWWSLIF